MISKQIKTEVFTSIISLPNFLGKYLDYDGIMTYLTKIWNLRELPSEDSRYKNAYDDVYQHVVSNNDWSNEHLFLIRLKLIDGEENYFISFIETTVHPTVRKNKDEIIIYVSRINSIIQSSGYRLILTGYFEDLPVYKFKSSSDFNDLPTDIIQNSIPICLEKPDSLYEYPSFTLGYDRWNDFGFITMFDLSFRREGEPSLYIGKVKIMKPNEISTWQTLPTKFTSLSTDYCSLGQSKDYYLQLKRLLGNDFYSFLLALRDVAIFPKINEQFENDNVYKTSLIRFNEQERLVRTLRFEMEGINPNEYFKFNYTYQPPYAKNTIALNFDFKYNTEVENRIYALIGKNGTGKTRILSSLAKNLSEKEPTCFAPRKPIYGKIFTVSYSYFDRFEIPISDAIFNYVYCGIRKAENVWKTDEEMLTDFLKSVKLIKEKELENEWYYILTNFIDSDILDIFFIKKEDVIYLVKYIFEEEKFYESRNILSSGQSIILFIISEILSQIRFDSLILFDEPETHLHPNAIRALLNTLFELVKRFQSFCIIATHSPLIIQEIPSRNIFIIEREVDLAFVRYLERESLGENLTVINQDIFGNREVPKHFVSTIQELVAKGRSYSDIISILESDNLPITSNVRLYVKALIPLQ